MILLIIPLRVIIIFGVGLRKIHEEEPHNINCSHNIITVIE
jgi:hypothetical protein